MNNYQETDFRKQLRAAHKNYSLRNLVYTLLKGEWDKFERYFNDHVDTYGPLTDADRKVIGDEFEADRIAKQ